MNESNSSSSKVVFEIQCQLTISAFSKHKTIVVDRATIGSLSTSDEVLCDCGDKGRKNNEPLSYQCPMKSNINFHPTHVNPIPLSTQPHCTRAIHCAGKLICCHKTVIDSTFLMPCIAALRLQRGTTFQVLYSLHQKACLKGLFQHPQSLLVTARDFRTRPHAKIQY